jgi:predicted dinucleotide-binding enzyme
LVFLLQEFKSYKIGIVGAGALGGALAIALNKKGFCITKIFSRSKASIIKLCSRLDDASLSTSVQEVSDNGDIIFITTTDNAIKSSVESASWKKDK